MNYTRQQLQEMNYEELCSLVQQKMITWSDFIDAQPELYEGYDEWLAEQGLERNNENAMLFIHQVEELDMAGEMSDEMNEVMDVTAKARKVLQMNS